MPDHVGVISPMDCMASFAGFVHAYAARPLACEKACHNLVIASALD